MGSGLSSANGVADKNLEPLVPGDKPAGELSATGIPRCSVCRDLRYLPATEGGGIGQLREEMAKFNLTEATPGNILNPLINPAWPTDQKPGYPTIPDYQQSARKGCRCCAFVSMLYTGVIRLLMQFGFTTVNGWGLGANDKDIHALVFRAHGTLRLRLTNVKWPSRIGRDIEWDVYNLRNSPNPIPLLRQTDPIAPMALQAAETIRKWLANCRANHPKCAITTPDFVPKRLIHIAGKDLSAMPCNPLIAVQFSSIPTLTLVSPSQPVPYVALSYCWGRNRDAWTTTTRSTLPRRTQQGGINAWTLPRTISEAIQLARLLGFEYIWVDALCIVQDDADDWAAEAARMADVYGAADLVISANVTGDCTRPTAGFQNFGLAYQTCCPLGGAFAAHAPGLKEWSAELGNKDFPHPGMFTQQDVIVLRMAHLHQGMAANVAGYRPLDTRAWTCQESLLGRRMLSLTSAECVWTCDEAAACECGFNQLVLEGQMEEARTGQMWESTMPYRPVQRLRRAAVLGGMDMPMEEGDLPTMDAMRNTWRLLVSDYSQRELTVEGDKMVAISGLARVFGKVFAMLEKEEDHRDAGTAKAPLYLAGLWRDSIHEDLLWLGQRFPQQLSMVLELGGADGKPPASPFPAGPQQDIANEPSEAAVSRLKWARERPARPSQYRAPSWSWASSNLCVSWLLDLSKWEIEMRGGEHSTIKTSYMTLLEVHIDAEPDEYGAVAAGYIAVKGPLVEVHRRSVPFSPAGRNLLAAVNTQSSPLMDLMSAQSRESASNAILQTADQANHAFVRTKRGLVFEYFPDDEFEPVAALEEAEYKCLFDGWERPCQAESCGCKKGWSDESFWCLRVNRVAVREETRPNRVLEGWLVLKWSEEDDSYMRIGVGHFGKIGTEANEFRLFEDAEDASIRII